MNGHYQHDNPHSILKRYTPKKSFQDYPVSIQQKVHILCNSNEGETLNINSGGLSAAKRHIVNRLALTHGHRVCFVPNTESKLKKGHSNLKIINVSKTLWDTYLMNSAFSPEFRRVVRALMDVERYEDSRNLYDFISKFKQPLPDIKEDEFVPTKADILITVKTLEYLIKTRKLK